MLDVVVGTVAVAYYWSSERWHLESAFGIYLAFGIWHWHWHSHWQSYVELEIGFVEPHHS